MALINKVGYSVNPLSIRLNETPNISDEVYSIEVTPLTEDMKFVLYAYPVDINSVWNYIQSESNHHITVTVTHSYYDKIAQREVTTSTTNEYDIDANTPTRIFNISSPSGSITVDYGTMNISDVTRVSIDEVRECFNNPIIFSATFDLNVYTTTTDNPLLTFQWDNLQHPRENTSYYIQLKVLNRLEGGFPIYNDITDLIPFENGETVFSYNDIVPQAKDPDEIWVNTYLMHYDDRGLVVADDVKESRIFDDGTTTSEYPDIHVGETPEVDDENAEDESEYIDTDDRPSVPSLDNIMTSSYVVTESELLQLKNFLWSADYHDNVYLLNNSPIENIVSIKTLPFDVSGASEEIKVGNVPTGINARKTQTNHKYVVGSVFVSGKYGNALDFEPFTSVSINLPFCGVHDLPTNVVMNRTLKVEYVFDVLTGACCAELFIGDAQKQTPFDYVMGNCGIDIPISAQNRTEVEIAQDRARVSGTMNVATGISGAIGSALMGNVVGAVSGVAYAGASAYNSYLDYATATYHTTTKGTIGSQLINYITNNCYLIYDRPIYTKPDTYAHDYGYPCEKTHTLYNLKGFTAVGHTVEINAPCNEIERSMLRDLLIKGVYLDWDKKIPKHNIKHDGECVFYKNESDILDVSKDITEIFRLDNVKWKEDTDSYKPIITFRKNNKSQTFNYVALRLNDVVKYYYVTREILRKGGIYEVELECDVLMSYASYIQGIRTIVSRQEFKNNTKIVDTNIALPVNRELVYKNVGKVGTPNGSIVVTVVNG